MAHRTSPLSADVFLRDLFTSKAVMNGGVIRRKARDIERFAGMDMFMREIQRRGYHVAENSGQLIIFCNQAPLRWLTKPPQTLSLKESVPKSLKDFDTIDQPRS